jgi:AcrR family transcriptional regulator
MEYWKNPDTPLLHHPSTPVFIMGWERARTEEQKESRVAEIVAATARLYDTHRLEDINLSLIAKEANFTRSNLYKYFNTKEEIFLEFIKRDTERWRQDVMAAYERERTYSVEEFAFIWVRVLVRHRRFLGLQSILYTILEKHVSVQSLVNFKRRLNDDVLPVVDLMCTVLPACNQGKATEFILLQSAVASGLYAMTNYSDVQQEVLDMPEFEHYRLDFTIAFQDAVEYLLQGILD